MQIEMFRAPDGRELAYVAHLPHEHHPRRAAFLYVHGIESHSGWFDPTARELNKLGYPVYAIDRRGSGINRENRGCVSGHVDQGIDLLEDLHYAVRHIRARSETAAIYLIGLSWGGKCVVAYDVRHPREAGGLVLITPGIKPKVDLSFREKLSVFLDWIFSPERQHTIPIEPEMFTTTPRHLDYIRNDPLRLHTVSASFLRQSRAMDKLLKRSSGAPHPPTLVFLAGNDRIIDNEETRRFFAGEQNTRVTVIEYPEQTHSIQLDAPERLAHAVSAWVESLCAHS